MNPNAIKIIEILEKKGFEARIAGGAVRDFLLGINPKDIDIATTATPTQVLAIFTKLGFSVVETGLQHGTVTVVMNHTPYEVTTLRIDKKTDGRFAEVEFVNDWKLDAERRDFTFNAMYMDKDGKVYDYFDGKSDLDKRYVRFVGKAEDRITEDFLRIMRFFRFHARMNPPFFPSDIEAVISKLAGGLEKISGERIWDELKKILNTPNCFWTVKAMARILAKELRLPNNDYHIYKMDFEDQHHLLKLIALYNFDPNVLTVMKERFKASSDEIEFVKMYFMLRDHRVTTYEIMKHIEKREQNLDSIRVITSLGVAEKMEKFFSKHGWFKVKWPVHAEQLMAEGFVPGKELGMELEKRRKEWLDKEFETL